MADLFRDLHATAEEVAEYRDAPLEKIPARILAQMYLQTAEQTVLLLTIWRQVVEAIDQIVGILDMNDPLSAKKNLQFLTKTMRQVGGQTH